MKSPAEAQIGDLVYSILTTVYGKQQARFRCEASRRQINLEQLAAAAIAGALCEYLQQGEVRPDMTPADERSTRGGGKRRSGPSRPSRSRFD